MKKDLKPEIKETTAQEMTKERSLSNPLSVTYVFGSSFDPPHFGHLGLLMLAVQKQPASQVLLLPSLARWDKSQANSLANRIQLTKVFAEKTRALGMNTRLENCEVDWGLPYQGTLHTLQFLRSQYPKDKIILLCGEDSLGHMPLWRNQRTGETNGSKILQEFAVWVAPRVTKTKSTFGSQENSGHRIEESNKDLDSDKENCFLPGVHWLSKLQTVHLALKKLGCSQDPETLSSSGIRQLVSQKALVNGFTFPEIIGLL